MHCAEYYFLWCFCCTIHSFLQEKRMGKIVKKGCITINLCLYSLSDIEQF